MIKTTGLSKKFGSNYAVTDCNIELKKGKIYGLLGPNGSGKSSLMKMIAGLFCPTKGSITVDDETLSYKAKSKIAFMATEGFIYDYMSVQNVAQYFEDFFEDFDTEKYYKLIDEFGLNRKMKVKQLSTGMHCKLKVAATLARNATYMMLDEPLNGIDLVAREQIMKAIIESANDGNMVLISSHFVEQMEPILDEVIFIKGGEVVVIGDAEDVRLEKNKSIVDLYKEVFAC